MKKNESQPFRRVLGAVDLENSRPENQALNKKIVDRHKPEDITLYQLTGGFVGLSLLLPLFGLFFSEKWYSPTAMDIVWLVLLSWGCTIFTFFLYIRALKNVSAFTMNLTLTLEPVYGIILAFLI